MSMRSWLFPRAIISLRTHARFFARRHSIEIEESTPRSPLGTHLQPPNSEPRAPHVLDRDHANRLSMISRQAFQQQFFSAKGSPTCTVGRFFRESIVELGRGHRGGRECRRVRSWSRDRTIGMFTAGGRPHRRSCRCRARPTAHRIDENVAVVAGVEPYLPPTVGTPNELPLAADTGDDARKHSDGGSWDVPARPKLSALRDRQSGARPMVKTVAQECAQTPGGRNPDRALDVTWMVVGSPS